MRADPSRQLIANATTVRGQRCTRLCALPAAVVVRAALVRTRRAGARRYRGASGRAAPAVRFGGRGPAGVPAAGRPGGARREPGARRACPPRPRRASAASQWLLACSRAARWRAVTLIPTRPLYISRAVARSAAIDGGVHDSDSARRGPDLLRSGCISLSRGAPWLDSLVAAMVARAYNGGKRPSPTAPRRFAVVTRMARMRYAIDEESLGR